MQDRFKFKGYWYNDVQKEWWVFNEPEFITGDGTAEIWSNSEGGAYPELPSDAELHLCQCTVKFMLHKGVYYDTDGDTYWFHYTDEIENATYRPFEEAIAEFINGFWQFLIKKEKQQIKEILK